MLKNKWFIIGAVIVIAVGIYLYVTRKPKTEPAKVPAGVPNEENLQSKEASREATAENETETRR